MISDISIVVPIYNEQNRIFDCLSALKTYCKKNIKNWEIIIVDDGSNYNYNIKNNKRIKFYSYDVNMGKGFATAYGVMRATKKYVLTTDCDLSTPLTELPKFLSYIKNCDIVIGNRLDKKSQVERKSSLRSLAGQVFPLIVNLLFKMGINDTQCGFKLYDTKKAKYLFRRLKTYRWAFDVEILYRAYKHGYFIAQLPVVWIHNNDSKVNVLRDSWRMFKDLIKIRGMKFD